MLADLSGIPFRFGAFGENVQLPHSSLYELLDFVAEEALQWRDRPDRRRETSETILTSQLCAHLNSAARHSVGWDILQFRIEEPDELHRGRRIDLIAAPSATTVWIDGRGYTDFDSLLPIECKRLPTAPEKDRDDREYVFSQYSTTGGVQRFKAGHHGAAHAIGAIIAYIQEETTSFWRDQVGKWINGLIEAAQPGWNTGDALHLVHDEPELGISIFRSVNERTNGSQIELRHLWIKMN